MVRKAFVALTGLTLAACGSPAGHTPAPRQTPVVVPDARMDAAAAWDADHAQLVMFGGKTGNTQDGFADVGDTWTWSTAGWVDHTKKLEPAPLRRSGAAMAWDPDLHRVVLAAGMAGGTLSMPDSWLWDGRGWTKGPDLPVHDTWGAASMAWDPVHHQLVLVMETALLVFDGQAWKLADPATLAPNGNYRQLAFDAATATVVLLDANDPNRVAPATMWDWNGADWRRRVAPAAPGTAQRSSAVDDPRTVLVQSPADGGIVDLVETHDGRTTAWEMGAGAEWKSLPSQGLPAHICFAVADTRNGRVIVVGGPDRAHDTTAVVTLSGSRWIAVGPQPKSPLPSASYSAPPTDAAVAVHPAKDYLSSPTMFGREYVVDQSIKKPGPIAPDPGEQTEKATDTWELWIYGTGDRLIDARVLVFAGNGDAASWLSTQFASVVGDGRVDIATPPDWAGGGAGFTTEPVKMDNGDQATLGRIIWRRGRVGFDFRFRDSAAKFSTDQAARLAYILDQRAASLEKS